MKFEKKLKEYLSQRWNVCMMAFLLMMAIIYGYRLFCLTPWYDELYTYYYFISKGPAYAAIHWPLPNNHVGYSVLSGFLNYLGNSYIGLRGVSYICALVNLGLIYYLGKKFLDEAVAFASVLLYAAMNLVNQMAVQGRGYTLTITCFLIAICMTYKICMEKPKKRYYIVFAGMLTLALYAVPSSVYLVMPVCISGGLFLLIRILKEKDSPHRLICLISSAICAALATIFLYMLIWLAIGSNLLVKDSTSIYYGIGHLQLIKTAPFAAIQTGIDYMLATPYIQSVARTGYVSALWNWLLALFNCFYANAAYLLVLVVVLGTISLMQNLIGKKREKNNQQLFFGIFLLVSIWLFPLMLIIQCALPYYRVFTYIGVILAFMIGFLMQKLKEHLKFKKTSQILFAGVVLFFCFKMFLCDYQAQYGARESQMQDAYEHMEIAEDSVICVTDCTQQYLLKFLYGITCENQQIEGADCFLLDKRMTDENYQEMQWEFYHYYNTIPWEYVNVEMTAVYENNDFIVYQKNKNA